MMYGNVLSVLLKMLIHVHAVYVVLYHINNKEKRLNAVKKRHSKKLTKDTSLSYTTKDKGWSCHVCTYYNKKEHALVCEICKSPRIKAIKNDTNLSINISKEPSNKEDETVYANIKLSYITPFRIYQGTLTISSAKLCFFGQAVDNDSLFDKFSLE